MWLVLKVVSYKLCFYIYIYMYMFIYYYINIYVKSQVRG